MFCSFLINLRTGGIEKLMMIPLEHSLDFGSYYVSPLPGR